MSPLNYYPRLSEPAPVAARDDDPLEEKTIVSETVYQGDFLKVNKELVTIPEGRQSSRELLMHPGAAGMIALDDEGMILLERQWRHPMRRSFWEIPAGKLDAGETALFCAQRELLEECGVHALRWKELGVLHNAIGYSNEHIVLFLAEDLSLGEQKLDEGEYLEVYRVSVEEALRMAQDGRITDVKTIVGLFWLERELKNRAESI